MSWLAEHLRDQQEKITAALGDAAARLERQTPPPIISFHEVKVLCWSQTWPSTACGFGGIGGRAMTPAPTVVVICARTQLALVYHNGRFAYEADPDDPAFVASVTAQSLPGATSGPPSSHA